LLGKEACAHPCPSGVGRPPDIASSMGIAFNAEKQRMP